MNFLIILVNILVTIVRVCSDKDNRYLKLNEHFYQHDKSDSKYKLYADKTILDDTSKSNEVFLVLLNIKPKDDIVNVETSGKQILRKKRKQETPEQRLKKETIRRQHRDRIRDVVNFMAKHMMTTIYFYDEIQRIKRDRIVKDELRKMVSYLEKPKNEAFKKAVLNYFRYIVGESATKEGNRPTDPELNDLLYNVLKDPFNDGVDN